MDGPQGSRRRNMRTTNHNHTPRGCLPNVSSSLKHRSNFLIPNTRRPTKRVKLGHALHANPA